MQKDFEDLGIDIGGGLAAAAAEAPRVGRGAEFMRGMFGDGWF
jgi:hypothetical protein